MRNRIALLAAALMLALPGAAAAQDGAERARQAGYSDAPDTPIYVEGRAALTLLMDQDVSGIPGASGVQDGDASFDVGFGGSFAVGYHLLDSVRVELEGVAETNDVDSASPLSPQATTRANSSRATPSTEGDTVTLGGFANVFYDFDTGTAFTPYLGGGPGFLYIDAEYGAFSVDDSDVRPAYQVLTGVTWAVTPATGLTLGYRYRRTIGDPEFDTAGGGTLETEYGSHGFQIGLRYRF